MMTTHRAACIVAACMLCSTSAAAQVTPLQPRDTAYVIVTPGLLGTPILPLRFTSAPLDVGVRNLVMGAGEARDVPITGRTVMELRGGQLTTTIDGQRQERRPGDFWVVEPGSAVSFATRGDVAVIRVIQLQERR
jgi:hypothetical protein